MCELKKILIVEDELDFARMVKMRLESVGYAVALAGDTAQGTKKVMEENFDLLVLDLMMPGGGGFELLDNVHEKPGMKNIPVIILTGKTIDDEVKDKAQSYNVADIIMKPYESKQFVQKIKALLPV